MWRGKIECSRNCWLNGLSRIRRFVREIVREKYLITGYRLEREREGESAFIAAYKKILMTRCTEKITH